MRPRPPIRLRPPRFGRPEWLRAPRAWLRDPALRMPVLATLVVAAFALGLAGVGRVPRAPTASVASPTQAVAPGRVSPAPTVAGNEALGTAAPVATSAVVPPAPPPATPTPTPDPAVWRFEGRVVDETGAALEEVCVVIGPLGCRPGSIRTDERGVYFVDMPQNATIVYELRFELAGYTTVYYRAQPSGPTVFDVVLRPS